MTRSWTVAILAGTVSFGCVKKGLIPDNSSQGSKMTSVKMKMPTKIGDKDVTGKMDGDQLVVKKIGGDCAFTDIDRSEKVTAGDVKIDASLKQGCDYSIVLSFGMATTDGKTLDKVFLTSNAYDGKSANPTLVKRDDLKGKSEITIKACVSVTAQGATALGVSPAECPSVSDDSIDGSIEPVIPQPTAKTFKLTSAPTKTTADNKPIIRFAVMSTNANMVHCAIAVGTAKTTIASTHLLYVENFMVATKEQQLPFDLAYDEEAFPELSQTGLNHDIFVYEACFDTKPAADKKPADAFKDCLAKNSCTIVTP